jgi:hypothetical protein
MPSLIDPHALADALRALAIDVDSGNVPHPDDEPRRSTAEINGFHVLLTEWPDGTRTLATREASWLSWSAPVELEVAS